MIGEINKDFYCTANAYSNGECKYKHMLTPGHLDQSGCNACINLHRKYPTLKQFQEEYGFGWTGAVYYFVEGKTKDWCAWCLENALWSVQDEVTEETMMVCACTPWGKPPVEWRP